MNALVTQLVPCALAAVSTTAPPDQHAHTNRLAGATSPYLLQHAHNPVDWYPWGPEALERAKKEDKPIFLSVGYSTCYWCHVMEREVFENEAIAKLMNDRFVCIKVDREERPDLDELYMTATQLMTRHGGWPNSVFLTPDLAPYYAGTYFGPTDQPGRPGFGTLIVQLGDAWDHQRARVLDMAARVRGAITEAVGERLQSITPEPLEATLVDRAVEQIAASYDPRDGGFGMAPKFPSDFYYPFLLDVHAARVAHGDADADTLAMVTGTLDAMAAGGIHDHVGGGFHRYATDQQWKVPHFEKMLYNQALLTVAYLDAYRATGDARYAEVARGILRFVAELFTGSAGQFLSALDAETDAVEGAYYTWTREEIDRVLGGVDAGAFLAGFELADVPIFPGHKHPQGGTLVATQRRAPTTAATRDALARLAAVRQQRPLPRLDDKAIASWNGMMIAACARAAEVLKEDSHRAAGARAARFVLDRMRTADGHLLRSVRLAPDGTAPIAVPQEGFLEDYASVISGLLALHRVEPEASAKAEWLQAARALAATTDALLWDEAHGGYFFAQAAPDLLARGKDMGDHAIPSGNSVMAHNLLDLWQATGDAAYLTKARRLLSTFSGALAQAPRNSVHMVHALHRLLALDAASAPPPQVTTDAGAAGGASAAQDVDATQTSFAQVEPTVRVEPTSVEPGGTLTVTVELAITKGWHLNAHPASVDFLRPTVVDVRPVVGEDGSTPAIEVVGIAYPASLPLKAAALGTIQVYEGSIRIVATVRVSEELVPESTLDLRVLASFQACSDQGTCLMPAEWSEVVRIHVVEAP